jgi:bacterioferritin
VRTVLTDQKVLGYLGRALSLELSAVQLYSTQARLVSNWGLDKAAQKLRQEAREETEHAERIIGRMIAHGAVPGASQLRPVKLETDLVSLLRFNRGFELELVKLYQRAVYYCLEQGHSDDQVFFQTLLQEEQQHAADLVRWIASLTQAPAEPGYRRSTGRK